MLQTQKQPTFKKEVSQKEPDQTKSRSSHPKLHRQTDESNNGQNSKGSNYRTHTDFKHTQPPEKKNHKWVETNREETRNRDGGRGEVLTIFDRIGWRARGRVGGERKGVGEREG